jgi:hypothetical protein
MYGTIMSYASATGDLSVKEIQTIGSGTYSSWTVNLSGGIIGSSGTSGTSGEGGGGTVNIIGGNNAGIYILSGVTGDTIYTAYNTTLDPSLSTPATVGGIAAGTTVASLSGITFVEFVDDLLFPVALPSYTIPTITMSGITSQTLEVGSTYPVKACIYGIKNDAGAFTQEKIFKNGSTVLTDISLTPSSESSIPAQFGYVDPNNPNYRYTSDAYSESLVVPFGSITYSGNGNYGLGSSKQNNKGNIDTRTPAVRSTSAPQSAGTNFATGSYTIAGIYPYFYGTSLTLPTALSIAAAISGGTATKVFSEASGTLAIPYNNPTTWLYIWLAYPSDYTTKTKWWVNALDNGDIDGSFITSSVTQAVNSPEGYWVGKAFKMHWSAYQTQQNTIEFRNS